MAVLRRSTVCTGWCTSSCLPRWPRRSRGRRSLRNGAERGSSNSSKSRIPTGEICGRRSARHYRLAQRARRRTDVLDAATAAEVLPQPCKHSWQDALSHPSLKPTMAGLVGGAAFRKILPWCARPQNPEHAIEHATRWNPGASAASSRGFALFDRKV